MSSRPALRTTTAPAAIPVMGMRAAPQLVPPASYHRSEHQSHALSSFRSEPIGTSKRSTRAAQKGAMRQAKMARWKAKVTTIMDLMKASREGFVSHVSYDPVNITDLRKVQKACKDLIHPLGITQFDNVIDQTINYMTGQNDSESASALTTCLEGLNLETTEEPMKTVMIGVRMPDAFGNMFFPKLAQIVQLNIVVWVTLFSLEVALRVSMPPVEPSPLWVPLLSFVGVTLGTWWNDILEWLKTYVVDWFSAASPATDLRALGKHWGNYREENGVLINPGATDALKQRQLTRQQPYRG